MLPRERLGHPRPGQGKARQPKGGEPPALQRPSGPPCPAPQGPGGTQAPRQQLSSMQVSHMRRCPPDSSFNYCPRCCSDPRPGLLLPLGALTMSGLPSRAPACPLPSKPSPPTAPLGPAIADGMPSPWVTWCRADSGRPQEWLGHQSHPPPPRAPSVGSLLAGASLTRGRRGGGNESESAHSGGLLGDELLAVRAHLALFVLEGAERVVSGGPEPQVTLHRGCHEGTRAASQQPPGSAGQ